jgi:hypothetical protein
MAGFGPPFMRRTMQIKFLRKKGRKHLHPWQERLAKRPDMEVVRVEIKTPKEEPAAPFYPETENLVDMGEGKPEAEPVGWDLEGMTRPNLVKFAAEKGISQPVKMKSKDLIEALRVIEKQ